jgi:hypothetical protein
MHRFMRTRWVLVPVMLSIVFVVLFYPVASQRFRAPAALGCTVIGLCVIWGSYFIRARILTRLSRRSSSDVDGAA